jgi:hypothetical protein
VRGTISAISEFAQQISWLGATLRQHRASTMKASYISPSIELLPCTEPTFRVFFDINVVEPDGQILPGSQRWLPQFDGQVVVLGFPIAARRHG